MHIRSLGHTLHIRNSDTNGIPERRFKKRQRMIRGHLTYDVRVDRSVIRATLAWQRSRTVRVKEVFRPGSAWATAGQTTTKARSDAHPIAAYRHAGTSELNCRHRRRRSRQVQRGTRAWRCKCARAHARTHGSTRSYVHGAAIARLEWIRY